MNDSSHEAGPTPANRTNWSLAVAFVLLVAAIVPMRGVFSDRPLDGHEVLVAQTAREMIRSGDMLVPTFNAEERLKKPPLMYWAVIGVARAIPGAGDVPSWAARLPSWLAGIALVGATIALGARVHSRGAGLLAGLLLATSVGYFTLANSARPEMLYGALAAIALLGFTAASLAPDRTRARRLGALVGWIGIGLATLAKGPHLPLLIVLGVVTHLLIARRGREIGRIIRPLAGLAVFTLIVGPWAWALIAHAPQTMGVWRQELFGNSAGDPGEGLWAHISPYYIYAPFQFLLPWAPCLLLGLFAPWSKRATDFAPARVLFWIVIATLVVMTIPDHRRWYYLVPIAPALAVLASLGTIGAMRLMAPSRAVRRLGTTTAIVIASGAAVAAYVVHRQSQVDPIVIVVIAVVIGAIATAAFACRRAACRATVGAAIASWAFLFAVTGHEPGWSDDHRYVEWGFAQDIALRVPDDDPLITWRVDESVLVYATDRPVQRVRSLDGYELPAGEETLWVVTREQFIDDVPAEWGATVRHRSALEDGDHEREVLLALTRRPPVPAG